ncbi:multidrug efflux ABC transporter permease LieB [Saccharothrix violaceirubra]|uniref:Transport permease protein n=1 Tax=Saccharothrix violaceirubra TaxID=413306 RepID=A0A7W7WW08_9PSEU|nr:ABC transporter permease [Saccharothrix violaceirubra]MBB4965058.1 ABC-2 type transport system permease protein [Saccharothrix violaceirubra]
MSHALTESATMVGRGIRLSRRNVDTLVMALMLPLVMMALFVYVFGGAIAADGRYIDYVVPGIILLCVGFGASSTALSVVDDLRGGMIDRLRSMPIHAFAVLTGHVVASVVRNALATTIVVLAAVAMGFRPSATPLEWLAVAGLLLLYVAAISWLAAAMGVVAKTPEAAGALNFLMLFLPYLSSAFVPTDTMPAVLRAISENQPVTPLIETVRGLLTGTAIGSHGVIALAWSAGLLIASTTVAVMLYRRKVDGG